MEHIETKAQTPNDNRKNILMKKSNVFYNLKSVDV